MAERKEIEAHTHDQKNEVYWETAPNDVAKTQIEQLNFLATSGHYWTITPDKFPAVHPIRVMLAQFRARGNLAKSFLQDRDETLDSPLRETLGIVATNLLQERQIILKEQLGDVAGEADEEMIAREIEFGQANQRLNWLSQYINWGFDEQVSIERFPELQMLTPDRLNSLRLEAAINDSRRLKDLQKGLPDDLKASAIGYMEDTSDSMLGNGLDDMLKKADGRVREHLKALGKSGSRQSS